MRSLPCLLVVLAVAPSWAITPPSLAAFVPDSRSPAGPAYVAIGTHLRTRATPHGIVLALDGATVRLRFAGTYRRWRLEPVEPQAAHFSLLAGASAEDWERGLPAYGGVAYRGVYPGIDAVYRLTADRRLKAEFLVRAGADAAGIRLAYEGVQAIAIDHNGALVIDTAAGRLVEHSPEVYQPVGGRRVAVGGSFRLLGGGEVGFQLGPYDHRWPLVIDPVLSYARCLGGSQFDAATAVAYDSAGNTYLAGWTESTNLPATSGSWQTVSRGGIDAFVAKFSSSGALVYCTYLGGRGYDRALALAVDAAGNAYVAGGTTSSDFPVRSAVQSVLKGGTDAFVAKLDASGTNLIYSTYLGGSGSDTANAIAVDGAGVAYIAGETTSSDAPLVAPMQASPGGLSDVYIAKLAPTGSSLLYSTFLGGQGEDRGYAIAVDGAGSAYVAGATNSMNFPVQNAFQSALRGVQDAFVVKLNPSGQSLAYSTYLGGSGGSAGLLEAAFGIAVDATGSAYVVGTTNSPDFPTLNAFQSTLASDSNDAFVAKLSGSTLVYSSYLGGTGLDVAQAVAVDSSGRAHVAGWTRSTDFPVLNASQPSSGGEDDAFVATLNAAGTGLIDSTYLGGASSDTGLAIAVDSAGHTYVAGQTLSYNFPTTGGLPACSSGGQEAFAAKVSEGSASDTNLGFESGALAPWRAFGGGSAAVVSGTASSGAFSLSLVGGPGGVYQDFGGLTPGQLYRISVRVRASPGTTAQAALSVHDTTGANAAGDMIRTPASGSWELFVVQFVATFTGRVRLHLYNTGGTGTLYWDDVEIVNQWQFGFDSGTPAPWAAFGNATVAVATNPVLSGAFSLVLSGGAGGVYQDIAGLTPGQSYVVRARVRSASGTTGQAIFWAHDTTGAGTVSSEARTPASGSWDELTLTFVATTTSRIRVHLYFTGGVGNVYWDDVQIVSDWRYGFESGAVSPWALWGSATAWVTSATASNGSFSLVLGGGNGGVAQDLGGFRPGQVYHVTARVRSAPGTAGQVFLLVNDTTGASSASDGWRVPSSSAWEALAVTFVATSSGRMHLSLGYTGGAGAVYWDDIEVTSDWSFGFESGALSPWQLFGGATASVVSSTAFSGIFSLALNGGSGGVYQDVAGLTPGQLYCITVRVRSAPGTTGQASFWVHDTAGANAASALARTPSSSTWEQFSVNFIATLTGRVRLHLYYTGGAGVVYWDDVQIVSGWQFSFESGAVDPWLPFSSATAAVSASLASSGRFSLAISNGPGGVYQDLSGLTPGRLYRILAWVRSLPGTAGQAMFWVHDTTGANTVSDTPQVPSSSTWEQFSVNFIATPTGRVRIHLYYTGGAGTLYWDDIEIASQWQFGFESGTLAPWLPFGGGMTSLATSTVYSGVFSLMESGTPGGVYQDIDGLRPGRTYLVVARARAAPGTAGQATLWAHDTTGANSAGAVSHTPSSAGWDLFTTLFTATSTGKIRLHLYYTGGGGAVYWDDAEIIETN